MSDWTNKHCNGHISIVSGTILTNVVEYQAPVLEHFNDTIQPRSETYWKQ